jgi:hypothetical protein
MVTFVVVQLWSQDCHGGIERMGEEVRLAFTVTVRLEIRGETVTRS